MFSRCLTWQVHRDGVRQACHTLVHSRTGAAADALAAYTVERYQAALYLRGCLCRMFQCG